MMQEMTREEQVLLAALQQKPLPEGPWDQNKVLELAENHALTPLLYDTFPEVELVKRRSVQAVQQYYRLFFATKYYVQVLAEAQIPVVVLKGFPVGQAYPIPEFRKAGDIDLLLLYPKDLDAAIKVLQTVEVQPMKEQHANYHIAMLDAQGIEVEIHTSLTQELDSEEANRKLEKLQQELAAHVDMKTILQNAFPVLTAGDQAFSLLLHMLHHFVRSGFGLKLLMDWVYFWNAGVTEAERQRYEQLLTSFGLCGFSEMISTVCYIYLGLKDATLCGEPKSKEAAQHFLLDVLHSKEFGSDLDEQMVMLRGTKLRDYVREFHHQMHLNYPRAGKLVVIWPLLWTITLFRFLWNNHRVRNTSLIKVLKNTKSRSGYMEEMELFRR